MMQWGLQTAAVIDTAASKPNLLIAAAETAECRAVQITAAAETECRAVQITAPAEKSKVLAAAMQGEKKMSKVLPITADQGIVQGFVQMSAALCFR
ncbi:hypothetical protein ACQCVE_10320 [Metabacillus sp. 113a]|uniref:hypothetical protein n=1 Tax=Metabacillus sp. 113a TaxID=3404706 RepID=UPI003CED83E1